MKQPAALAALIEEYFDGVLQTIDSGRWGRWVLDREMAARGHIVLVHAQTGYSVALGTPDDWIAHVAAEDWATAEDVGQLLLAIRDLEYARWLGLLPDVPDRPPRCEHAPAPGGKILSAAAE